jgi:hypothetical protein
MKWLVKILFLLSTILLIAGCEKERDSSGNDAILRFSADTISFDTIFTTSDVPVKILRVGNPTSESLNLSEIRLSGGDASYFKLNINGQTSNELFNVQIPPNDSIYVFIELKQKPGIGTSLIAEDSILFRLSNIEQRVKLLAMGQNFRMIKSEKLKSSRWTNDLPYLVYNYVYVDSGQVLTIDAGTQIHFHTHAGLYVKGTLIVNGTADEPVVCKGDRSGNATVEPTNQWNGIVLFSGSRNNKIEHAIIKNGNIGLQVGTIEQDGYASVELNNTRIENMGWAGIWAMKSKITASNCIISNVKNYNTALLLGGDYQFYHTSFVNYNNGVTNVLRETETLIVSNYLASSKSGAKYVGDMKQAIFGNCVIAGSLRNELMVAMDPKGQSNFLFDHCLIQMADTAKLKPSERFVGNLLNVNPGFTNPRRGNYEPDSLSVIRNYGKQSYAKMVPSDIRDESRLNDKAPDLGAYEWLDKKNPRK